MADFQNAQVSMNLLDYRITSPIKVWEACRVLGETQNVNLIGSEVIGLIPEDCLLEAGSYASEREYGQVPEEKALIIHRAIDYMGLDKLKPFDPQEKVLEYALQQAGLIQ
jgi:glutamate formiminotransferase/formiminotetrahydrofolate cyclodeaminase